ncbi:hypothetical protein [Sphingobium lignivorans]|uniref:Uncharacterized protein n=1 Tax=Sphingobium lignivorans TaxID=2735886 RepID=A0ABR6NJH5_9SPHN|nr:hypothetical protein [Sphingobium lignivorans]MBB5987434.1 hypothetical protein [Sphingobium lignivorans]
MTSAPLLDLDTIVTRPSIRIDGALYHIVAPSELSIKQSHQLAAAARRLEELNKLPALRDDDAAELVRIVLDVSETVLAPIPADVRARLSDAQRMSVIEVFTLLLLKERLGTVAATMTDQPSTGATSSPGSSASMGGRRSGGSKKRHFQL